MKKLLILAALLCGGCEFPAKHYYYEGQKVYQCPEARGLECERRSEPKPKEVIQWSRKA